MPRNVEIKATITNINDFKKKASELSKSEGIEINQEDTFFNVPDGRLKLRILRDKPSELIYYKRDDVPGPKQSNFTRVEISNPLELKAVLCQALGSKGIVKKRRILYMVDQTRVHVDQVEGLGNFMELEVMLKDDQNLEDGQKISENLMEQLGVQSADLLDTAYVDMLNKQQKATSS